MEACMLARWIRIAGFLASAGCATSEVLTRPLSGEQEKRIDEALRGQSVTITQQGGARLEPDQARVSGGAVHQLSIRLLESHWDEQRPAEAVWEEKHPEVPIASVQRIAFRDHGHGALQGLKAGASIGAITVGVAGFSLANLCLGESCRPSDPLGVAVGAALVGGAVFGLIGALLGGVIGAPTTIEFRDAVAR
jgi:hypothetical protein